MSKKATTTTIQGRTIGGLTLYTVEEVAALLGIQPRTLRDYLAQGRIRGNKVANRWYVSAEALRVYFEDTRPDGTPR